MGHGEDGKSCAIVSSGPGPTVTKQRPSLNKASLVGQIKLKWDIIQVGKCKAEKGH